MSTRKNKFQNQQSHEIFFDNFSLSTTQLNLPKFAAARDEADYNWWWHLRERTTESKEKEENLPVIGKFPWTTNLFKWASLPGSTVPVVTSSVCICLFSDCLISSTSFRSAVNLLSSFTLRPTQFPPTFSFISLRFFLFPSIFSYSFLWTRTSQ